MVRRLAEELAGYVEALGVDGRLLQLQLFEATNGIDQIGRMLERDYSDVELLALDNLRHLPMGDLLDSEAVANAIGLPANLATHLQARGYRQLSEAAQLPSKIADELIAHFGSLQALYAAEVEELVQVTGLSQQRARVIIDGLARLNVRND